MLTKQIFISSKRLVNFNKISKKDLTFVDIKRHKKGFLPLSRRYIFGKATVERKYYPPYLSSFKPKRRALRAILKLPAFLKLKDKAPIFIQRVTS